MPTDPRNIIIAKISTGLTDMLGAVGAHATMRNTGHSSSGQLWPDWPSGLTAGEACPLLADSLKRIGMFQDVRLQPEGDVIRIEVRGCEFAHLGDFEATPIGERSVCFFGFGLIEKSLARLTGNAYRVSLERRDEASDSCVEVAVRR
ncbi:MAG TPA: hypothetical protein ENO14_04085 [Chromatiales bacterium]|nr:hypothetical protein [Chromatiales bacterium]